MTNIRIILKHLCLGSILLPLLCSMSLISPNFAVKSIIFPNFGRGPFAKIAGESPAYMHYLPGQM